MRKFQQFFYNLADVRSTLRGSGTTVAKEIIGDSTNNNRTLTVVQTIRLLDATGEGRLAQQLESVREVLEPVVLKRRNNNRVDPIDISEFVSTYRELVMNKGKLRTQIGAALRGV